MTYAAGDTVVHPQHGTATVEGIVERDVGNGPEAYLQLQVDTRGLKIMVPVGAVEAAGIRNLATRKEAEAILAVLEAPSDVPEAWTERNAATTERVKSHHLDQVSMVVRDLSRHQERATKPLSMKERDQLAGCLDLVARELSLALDMSEEDTKRLIVCKSLRENISIG